MIIHGKWILNLYQHLVWVFIHRIPILLPVYGRIIHPQAMTVLASSNRWTMRWSGSNKSTLPKCKPWCSDWWFQSSEKNESQLGWLLIIPNIWENKTCSKPPTSAGIFTNMCALPKSPIQVVKYISTMVRTWDCQALVHDHPLISTYIN